MKMKVKYMGSHPEVEFEGIIFKRGELKEVDIKRKLPADFEKGGKNGRISTRKKRNN